MICRKISLKVTVTHSHVTPPPLFSPLHFLISVLLCDLFPSACAGEAEEKVAMAMATQSQTLTQADLIANKTKKDSYHFEPGQDGDPSSLLSLFSPVRACSDTKDELAAMNNDWLQLRVGPPLSECSNSGITRRHFPQGYRDDRKSKHSSMT